MSEVKGNRPYRQTKRAERVAETKKRIVEAAIRLHSTLGPAQTTLSEVANEAEVSRPTLYSHFPSEKELLSACTLHGLRTDPPPDPSSWIQVTDPNERVKHGLADLYSYYERNESLTANILRDMQVVPAMKELHAPMLEAAFDHMRRVLCDGYRDESGQTRRLREATVALALDFRTWQILVRDRGCATSEAIDLISQLISRAGQ